MTGVTDSFNRPINYLRISVTDRCNLRCIYCMPLEGIDLLDHGDILRYEEILQVARAAVELGISRIRLTGGEPLVRARLAELVRMLADIGAVDDLSLTTNGILLKQYASDLKSAGLHRVNVSLDSLKPERFSSITRTGSLEDVLSGIEAANAAGLQPVKINTVVMRGINDEEIVDFARKTVDEGWHVRFIEFMPVGDSYDNNQGRFMSLDEITKQIEELGPLQPGKLNGNGPAKYYRLAGASGTIGFISPISKHFCFQCNRLRLTADGKLRPCLLSDDEIDLRSPLREGAGLEELKTLIRYAIDCKPACHQLNMGTSPHDRSMCQIGG